MMLKPLAIGMLTAAALCATAAFANDQGSARGDTDWSWQGHDQGGDSWSWQDKDWWQDLLAQCEKNATCDKWEDQWDSQGDDHHHHRHDHPASAPEIDPAGALGALTLLLGGLAMVRGQRPSGKSPA